MTTALQLVADRAREVADADLAVVLLRHEGSDDFSVGVVSGVDDDDLVGSVWSGSTGVLGSVMTSAERVVLADLALEPSALAGGVELPATFPDMGPVVAVPLCAAGGVTGALTLGWAGRGSSPSARPTWRCRWPSPSRRPSRCRWPAHGRTDPVSRSSRTGTASAGTCMTW